MSQRKADEIRQQMEQVRGHLGVEMDQIFQNARTMTDWRYYWRMYPWYCVGAAAALGYLIVPRRLELMQPDEETLARLARKQRLVVEPRPQPQERSSVFSALFTMLSGALVRGAMAYLGTQASEILAARSGMMQTPPPRQTRPQPDKAVPR